MIISEQEVESEAEVFRDIIRSLHIALKSSVFYEPNHPLCINAVNNFGFSLNDYLHDKDKITLGISQDKLFIDGISIKGKDGRYGEIANFLHQRGIISISILKNVDHDELKELFKLTRYNGKTIREKGGILNLIPPTPHIKIKEVDYSALLSGENTEYESEEEKVWQALFKVVDESKEGKLPGSKADFMVNFFKDTEKSAGIINKIYKEATKKLKDESVVKDIRGTLVEICKYFKKYSNDRETKGLKLNVMRVISQLPSDLITSLFEKTVVEGQNFDLSEEITRDFSDSYIAGFIESLISNEDSFNENLLKVFDKLAPNAQKADNMVSLVADKLFSKRVLNPNTLTKLQMSIKEIFKNHPESSFMNQLHQITVDSVVNRKIDTLIYVAKLSPLINKFAQQMEEGKLKKEKIWLLLNILWLENDAAEFQKFSRKITEVMPELLDSKDIERIRELLEFFTENTRDEQKNDVHIAEEINDAIQRITTKETLESIISFIPEASMEDLKNIFYILIKAKKRAAGLLLDAYIKNKNPVHRKKFRLIFSNMKKTICMEILNRLDYCKPNVLRDMLDLLKEYAPRKAHLVAKKLIAHEDAQVRWEALNGFIPWTNEEMYMVFSLFKKEKDEEVQKNAAIALLETKDIEIIDGIFKHVQRRFCKKKLLLNLIELCGQVRAQVCYHHLKTIFLRKTLFNTKKKDSLRIAAANSLVRLQKEEAVKLVKDGLHDRSKHFREMCKIIIELDHNEKDHQMNCEVTDELVYEY